MRALAVLGQPDASGTNVPGVAGPTVLPVASGTEKDARATLLVKGRTPVMVERMAPFLNRYPDRAAPRLLELGFKEGFRIPCSLGAPPPRVRNLKSTLARPSVVTAKLAKEVELGRMGGPFAKPPIEGLVVSPLGVVPKKEPNKFRLIHHLLYPHGGTVNAAIDPELCSVSYASFDCALKWVRCYGKGALLAKADVETAFRLLPVHPESQRFLGCVWQGAFYVDRCLPMGCSLSCALFETFSSFLEWVVRDVTEVPSIIHYLDDFLCIGPANSSVCRVLLGSLQYIAERFGIPLVADKTEGPVSALAFLGIVIDTEAMECRLPEEKLRGLVEEVVRASS
ncbi:uncharacterized protein [Pyxicephalus adspersus]|uniref:uncharacterized protein n=1 Tax=Pyxicephalus adspersus TaxID=30357 RepID=UPI003B5BEA75